MAPTGKALCPPPPAPAATPSLGPGALLRHFNTKMLFIRWALGRGGRALPAWVSSAPQKGSSPGQPGQGPRPGSAPSSPDPAFQGGAVGSLL